MTKPPGARLSRELIQSLQTVREQFSAELSDPATAARAARQFRSIVLPKRPVRPRGRKRQAAITAAYADWKAGMRGLALHKKHVKGWAGLSAWRRTESARRLRNAIHTRHKREKKNAERSLTKDPQSQPDEPAPTVSLTASIECQPDKMLPQDL